MIKHIYSFNKTLIFLVTIALFCACSGDKTNEETNTTTVDSTAKVEDPSFDKKMSYKLPSPVELYVFMVESKVGFNKEILNPTTNASKYYTTANKAINFGIYASDLAYCTVFEKNQESFILFSSLKKMADELNLTEGFNELMLKRLDKNINNSDSLYRIANNSYWDACTFLEQQGKTDLLTMIVTGGWVESVYIAVNSVPKFSTSNETVIKVAEQQFLLENLINYLKTVNNPSKESQDILAKLKNLQLSFDKLYENTDEVITKKQYDEISAKIKALRKEFVS